MTFRTKGKIIKGNQCQLKGEYARVKDAPDKSKNRELSLLPQRFFIIRRSPKTRLLECLLEVVESVVCRR